MGVHSALLGVHIDDLQKKVFDELTAFRKKRIESLAPTCGLLLEALRSGCSDEHEVQEASRLIADVAFKWIQRHPKVRVAYAVLLGLNARQVGILLRRSSLHHDRAGTSQYATRFVQRLAREIPDLPELLRRQGRVKSVSPNELKKLIRQQKEDVFRDRHGTPSSAPDTELDQMTSIPGKQKPDTLDSSLIAEVLLEKFSGDKKEVLRFLADVQQSVRKWNPVKKKSKKGVPKPCQRPRFS